MSWNVIRLLSHISIKLKLNYLTLQFVNLKLKELILVLLGAENSRTRFLFSERFMLHYISVVRCVEEKN